MVAAEGASISALRDAVNAQTPEGWEITDMPVAMPKGSQLVRTTATIARRECIREVEADDMGALEALVPEGSRLLSVRVL